MSEIEIRRSPADPASSAPPATMAVRRSTSTRRNGATAELEITFTGRRRIAGLEKPLARHRRVSHPESRTAGPHLRRIHVGNSRTRPSPADRGCRTDCRDQAGARRPCSQIEQPRKHFIRPEPQFMPDIQIKTLKSSPDTCATLSEMLVEAVANGGSVSFMHPLPLQAAEAFWRNSLGFGRPRRADRSRRL